jgi:hypothetical protein
MQVQKKTNYLYGEDAAYNVYCLTIIMLAAYITGLNNRYGAIHRPTYRFFTNRR